MHGIVPGEENTSTTGKDIECHAGGGYWESINHDGGFGKTLLTISLSEPFNPEEEICKKNDDEREVEGIPHLHDIVGQAR